MDSHIWAEKKPQRDLVCASTERLLCIHAQGCSWHISEVWSELLVTVGTHSAELASLWLQLWKLTGGGIWDIMSIAHRDGGLTWHYLSPPMLQSSRMPQGSWLLATSTAQGQTYIDHQPISCDLLPCECQSRTQPLALGVPWTLEELLGCSPPLLMAQKARWWR